MTLSNFLYCAGSLCFLLGTVLNITDNVNTGAPGYYYCVGVNRAGVEAPPEHIVTTRMPTPMMTRIPTSTPTPEPTLVPPERSPVQRG